MVKLNYDDIEIHHNTCEFALIHCKNQYCDESLLRPELAIHDAHCEYERNICNGCNEVITKGTYGTHNCISEINTRLNFLESVLTETVTKLENPPEESEQSEKGRGAMCVRHEYIQDYSLEFSINHHARNHYQITIPEENSPFSEYARCLILRVVVHDSGVAKLFSRCSVRQAGEEQGINLSNHIMPANGIPCLFETFLPWNSEGPSQIVIEWDKSPYSTQITSNNFSQTHNQQNTNNLHSYSMGSMQHTAIPAMSVNGQSFYGTTPENQNPDITQGIIYLGIAGYME